MCYECNNTAELSDLLVEKEAEIEKLRKICADRPPVVQWSRRFDQWLDTIDAAGRVME